MLTTSAQPVSVFAVSGLPVSALLVSAGLLVAAAAPAPAEPASARVERCISQARVSGPVVQDDGQVYLPGNPAREDMRRIVFRGGKCPGIDRMSTLIIETTGSGYCVGDHVRGVNLPATIPGPVCVIESFEKVPAK